MFPILFIAVKRLINRRKANRIRRLRSLYTYTLLAAALITHYERGPYCHLDVANHYILAQIFAGDVDTTKKHLRVSSRSCRRLILLNGPRKRSGWTFELEVALFLFWLACGTSYRVVSAVFIMPRSTVNDLVRRILKYMITLLPLIVRLPSLDQLDDIGRGFARMGRSAIFLQCVGAIDGCHVRIKCPVRLHDQYYNRKQYYSINLQAVVDHGGLFIDILSGYPGSVHDSRVFRNSPIFRDRLYPPAGYFIVGDSGYLCRERPITIITPFKEPLNDEKRAFNLAFSRARVVVEQSFGLMKIRWRSIFKKALELSIENAISVIAACTVMHNICITAGDIIPDDHNDLPQPLPPRVQHDEVNGVNARNLLLRLFTIEQMN